VPAFETVRVHVAVALLPEPLRVVVEVVQEEMPAVPLTDHVTVPVGVAPPAGPVTVAV
jgi:hypothetical protein